MSAAMMIPTACIILLCRVGLTDVLPWFTQSLAGVAMFGGMLLCQVRQVPFLWRVRMRRAAR